MTIILMIKMLSQWGTTKISHIPHPISNILVVSNHDNNNYINNNPFIRGTYTRVILFANFEVVHYGSDFS